MGYSPNNAPIYLAAFAGALAGFGASNQPIEDDGYSAEMADAFAQEVDTVWGVGSFTNLDLSQVEAISQTVWTDRSPLPTGSSVIPADYFGLATAVVALSRAGTAQVEAEGINPNAGGGGGIVASPLTRTKWIDAYTSTPSFSQNGAPSTPYASIPVWLASLTSPPPSADDSRTLQLALLSPSGVNEGAGQTWTIPPGRNLEISSPSSSFPSNQYGSPTINWANSYNGAFAPGTSVLTFSNVNLIGFTLTASDVAGAPVINLQLIGNTQNDGTNDQTNGVYSGTLNYSGCTNGSFARLLVQRANATVTVTGPATPTFQLVVLDGTWSSAGLGAASVVANNSSITDTGSNLTTTGAQLYTNCAITANGIKTTGIAALTFIGCTFARGTTVTAASGSVVFDGPSYASFLAANGVAGASTVITVLGGYLGAPVAGTNINNPSGNACTVSINGSGASAGFTGGGNWYTATALAADTATTVSDGGGAVKGDTMRFTRTDTSGNVWTLLDAGTGAVATVGAGRGVTLYFNGTAWALQ